MAPETHEETSHAAFLLTSTLAVFEANELLRVLSNQINCFYRCDKPLAHTEAAA